MDVAYPLEDGLGGSTSLGAGLCGCISPRVSNRSPKRTIRILSHIDRFHISVDIGLVGVASSPAPRIDSIGGAGIRTFLGILGSHGCRFTAKFVVAGGVFFAASKREIRRFRRLFCFSSIFSLS